MLVRRPILFAGKGKSAKEGEALLQVLTYWSIRGYVRTQEGEAGPRPTFLCEDNV